ncbi:MAG: hypothetical protein VKM34_10735, partial [Cyanobacteriota bacterium]|nr:hypothetical protein [Cyanobacteriota bacterium]
MTDPTHAALERLVIMASNELDTPGPWVHTREQWDNAIAAARAALAQPTTTERPAVPEGREPAAVAGEPSDEELLDEWGKAVINFPGESWSSTALAFARAVLARWGTPNLAEIRSSLGDAPAPTAKEVGRLAAWLRNQALAFQQNGDSHHYAYRATRAADLLERQAAPAEGEVAELVRWLRMQGEAQKPGPNSLLPDQTKKERHAVGMKLTRAADLLEQFSLGGWIMPSVEQAAPAEGEVAELAAEIRHFLNGYRQMRGLDPENIYSIHRGDAMEA